MSRSVSVLLALLVALIAPLRLMAHGGGVAQITDAPAGPYRVFAWTSPDPWRAGEDAHVTVAVTRMEADQTFPITDAQVTLRLFWDSQPDQPLTLQATPVSVVAAGFYEVDHKLSHDGLWRVEVTVQGDQGAGSVSFVMQAAPAATNNWFVWAGGALALLVVIGFLFGARKRSGVRAISTQHATPSSVVQE
ncbi:MAG: FixH family protein [Caldilinea sp.]